MSDRIDINDLQPEAYKAMFGLEKYLGTTELEPRSIHYANRNDKRVEPNCNRNPNGTTVFSEYTTFGATQYA